MNQDEIGREEIRHLLGVSAGTLSNLINHSNANMPKPINERILNNRYNRKEIMAWIATDPMNTVFYSCNKRNKTSENAVLLSCLSFIFGIDGATKRLKSYQRTRPLITERMSVLNLDGDNGPLLS